MSTFNSFNVNETGNKDVVSSINKEESSKSSSQNAQKKPKSTKIIFIILIALGVLVIITLAVALPLILIHKKKKKDKEENFGEDEGNKESGGNEESKGDEENGGNEEEKDEPNLFYDLNENNHIKTEAYKDFVIPSDGRIQVVGSDFEHKNSTFIVGRNNKTFIIDDNGTIENVTEDDFPLYYSFNESITNGSCLFKDVKCFKIVNLSKMDSTKMIDASNMFENSNFEEIYFGTEKNGSEGKTNTRNLEENSDNITQEIEEDSDNERRKDYFDTSNIKNVREIFLNCGKLKRIQLPPFFNVGKNARGMFKGCSRLEEVNTTLISSNEIEEMESMFEDCRSLKEISFSNEFLTGEIKSLVKVFKNTNLNILDISYLRLYSLENYANVFEGASIKGTLKVGKYYSNDNIRNNLFKEIAHVTDSNTNVFVPSGTTLDRIFEDIYYSERNVRISVTAIDIDYNIHYREDENYKLYSDYLHVGLGWDFDQSNVYDLDSSVVTFDSNFNYLD